MQRRVMTLMALALAGTVACSSDSPPAGGGSGGSTSGSGGGGGRSGGSGGSASGSGGSTGSGGSSASGGSTGSGGSSSSGGSTGSGGSSGSGGSTGSDGGGDAGDARETGASETGGGDTGGGSATMSFFVTSVGAGTGGNLGGLAGADAKCKMLATAVSAELGAKNWKAYLSTSTVNARDRIGTGPWRNAKGEIIANNLEQLHDQGANGMLNSTWPIGAMAVAKILDEKGMPVPSGGGMPQQHDILTGTNMMGMVDGTNHCSDWTAVTGMGTVGHSNRDGGGRPPSWTTAHPANCAALGSSGPNVGSGGGRGSIYCFAAN
ncbi:MAG TPA: hypothetical protein VGG33_00025 [Polyangia bacterium]